MLSHVSFSNSFVLPRNAIYTCFMCRTLILPNRSTLQDFVVIKICLTLVSNEALFLKFETLKIYQNLNIQLSFQNIKSRSKKIFLDFLLLYFISRWELSMISDSQPSMAQTPPLLSPRCYQPTPPPSPLGDPDYEDLHMAIPATTKTNQRNPSKPGNLIHVITTFGNSCKGLKSGIHG
ncbi:hypothetical protein V6Z11_D03G078000 [Gossypium hirsutum]